MLVWLEKMNTEVYFYNKDIILKNILTMPTINYYKYIRYNDLEGMDEFYDLQEDPYEVKNIIDDPEKESVLNEAQIELDKLLNETDYVE